jgi:hypothetical protein
MALFVVTIILLFIFLLFPENCGIMKMSLIYMLCMLQVFLVIGFLVNFR